MNLVKRWSVTGVLPLSQYCIIVWSITNLHIIILKYWITCIFTYRCVYVINNYMHFVGKNRGNPDDDLIKLKKKNIYYLKII